jgi:hypothetical protein
MHTLPTANPGSVFGGYRDSHSCTFISFPVEGQMACSGCWLSLATAEKGEARDDTKWWAVIGLLAPLSRSPHHGTPPCLCYGKRRQIAVRPKLMVMNRSSEAMVSRVATWSTPRPVSADDDSLGSLSRL